MSRTITLLAAATACAAPAKEPAMHQLVVLDSFLAYREVGTGSPVVFLHGNPTSSHLWRDVLPHVPGRRLAPDLIGMGASGKPDIAYRFADHARYLDAWFDALDLHDVVLVGHDWGGALAMDWAARHPTRVKALVVFETFLRPMQWSAWSPEGKKLFQALRTPGVGEQIALEQNQFLARSLEHGIQRGVTEADRAAYAAPFPDAKSRRPLLQWPREIPIDGEPADVVAVVERYGAWLAETRTPKLLITFAGPSVLVAPDTIAWAKQVGFEVVALGPAGHHAPEDRPREIADAIARFIRTR